MPLLPPPPLPSLLLLVGAGLGVSVCCRLTKVAEGAAQAAEGAMAQIASTSLTASEDERVAYRPVLGFGWDPLGELAMVSMGGVR